MNPLHSCLSPVSAGSLTHRAGPVGIQTLHSSSCFGKGPLILTRVFSKHGSRALVGRGVFA